MIRVKSTEAFRSIAKGIDPRLASVVLVINTKFKDVSIVSATEKEVHIDAGIYSKPEETTEAINKMYPCASYLESTKTIKMVVD